MQKRETNSSRRQPSSLKIVEHPSFSFAVVNRTRSKRARATMRMLTIAIATSDSCDVRWHVCWLTQIRCVFEVDTRSLLDIHLSLIDRSSRDHLIPDVSDGTICDRKDGANELFIDALTAIMSAMKASSSSVVQIVLRQSVSNAAPSMIRSFIGKVGAERLYVMRRLLTSR